MDKPVDYFYKGQVVRTYATPRADGEPDVVVLHPRGGVEYTAKNHTDAQRYLIDKSLRLWEA